MLSGTAQPPAFVNGAFPSVQQYGFPSGNSSLPGIFFTAQRALGFYFVTTGTIGCTGLFLGSDGTAPLPGFSFISDNDTGIFRSAANILGFSCAGTHVAGMDSTGIFGGNGITGSFFARTAAGTAAAPTYSFVGDTGNGIYRPAANQFGIATNSAARVIISNTLFHLQTGVALRLGNTYVAVAPGAATGSVTIQDGAGNTYRVPVLV